MATAYSTLLGLALPVQGELSGTWGDMVDNGITRYVDIAVAGTVTLTNDGAVTLSLTNGDSSQTNIVSSLTGAGTVSAQFAIIKVTGTLTTAKVLTPPSSSRTYVVVNTATGSTVTVKASGQTGISVAVGETAFVYFNGTDYAKVAGSVNTGVTSFTAGTTGFTPSTATTGAVTLAGTLATTNGGTGLTSFTSGGVVYASSTSALATGSGFTFDGSSTLALGPGGSAVFNMGNTTSYGVVNGTGTNAAAIYFNGATRTSFGSYLQYGATNHVFLNETLGSELMRILNTGYVGIGTSSPTARLDVISPSGLASVPAAIFRAPAGVGNAGGLGLYATDTDVNARNWYLVANSSSFGDFLIKVGASQGANPTGGTTVAAFTSAGNVGIGTSSPTSKLQVGTGAATSTVQAQFLGGVTVFENSGATTLVPTITFNNDLDTGINNPGANLLGFYTNGAERMRISSNGGFSVGTTADPGAGAIYATGNITAYYSDARLKTVSGKIENALDKVAQLSGVYYTNNSVAKSFGYDSDEVQVGVLAQDVEAVLPQIVKAAPFDLDQDGNSKSGENYKTVQYERLVPLLIEAINELQAKVKALEAK